jgi:predicted DNA-binding transcriptional regulator YafY
MRVNYLSLSSDSMRRKLVPIVQEGNGLRWHIQTFDLENDDFGDVVLTRIAKTQEIGSEVAERELLGADEQWARMVEMELVPHPAIKWPKAVEADYAMTDGVLRIKSRAALAGYVLRRWSIDSSPDHRLDSASHHLWLRNPQTLYGVESAALAPGYAEAGQSADFAS